MATNGRALDLIESALTAEQTRALEQAAVSIAETAGHMADNVSAVAGRFTTAARTSVRERPVPALLGALAIGFVIGVLWRS